MKCDRGSMRFGTQRSRVSVRARARACAIVSTNVVVFWCTEPLYVYNWAHILHTISEFVLHQVIYTSQKKKKNSHQCTCVSIKGLFNFV